MILSLQLIQEYLEQVEAHQTGLSDRMSRSWRQIDGNMKHKQYEGPKYDTICPYEAMKCSKHSHLGPHLLHRGFVIQNFVVLFDRIAGVANEALLLRPPQVLWIYCRNFGFMSVNPEHLAVRIHI